MLKTLGDKKRTYVNPINVAEDVDRGILAGAKILFINMPLRESSPPNCLPLGPALLAARLREYEVVPTMIDLNAYRPDEKFLSLESAKGLIERHISKNGEPDVVALSGMITTLRWQTSIVEIMRELLPDTFIVTGNGLATELGEILFDWLPGIDAIAQAESDYSIIKVVHDAMIIKERTWDATYLSGLLDPYYFGEVRGRHRFFYDGGRPQDLDDVPFPAYDLLEQDVDGFGVLESYLKNPIWGEVANNRSAGDVKMMRSINTVSSRGCPFNCSFCYRGATGERRYSIRSAENILREFNEYRRKYNVDFIGLLDDNFMVSRDRILKMAPLFHRFTEATGVRWGTHGRLDDAADISADRLMRYFNNPLRVDQMAAAGCVYIGFGAESADASILESMGKGGFILSNGFVNIDGHKFPRTMVEGIRNTRMAGIQDNCTWIMGYPGETLEQLRTSVGFVKWQLDGYGGSVNTKFFIATAYPGTKMFSHPIVRRKLHENFGVNYDEGGKPVCDENLKNYILELDDATKVMTGKEGPLNFSAMPEDIFLRAKQFSDEGRTLEILGL